MRTPGYLQPFAADGDKTTIPSATQADGSVSFQQGWGPDYQKDQATDPTAKPVDRGTTNYLMWVLSQLLNRWQTETYPEWISPANNGGQPYPYLKGAVVRVPDDLQVLRISLVNNNTETPSASQTTDAWGDPVVTNAILNSVGLPDGQQYVGTKLALNAGGTALPPGLDANNYEIITASWAKLGFSSQCSGVSFNKPPSSGYIILPSFLMNTSAKRIALMWGSGEIPVTAQGTQAAKYVRTSFPLSFATVPAIVCTPTFQPTTAGLGTIAAFNNNSVSSFTPIIDASATSGVSNDPNRGRFTNVCSFNWFAIGEI